MTRLRLDRYLLREAALSWVSVIVVLLVIMLSTRFASLLSDIAKGDIPRSLLFTSVLLSALQYLVILVPVSQLLATMLSMGRLYKDNEVAAMMGCGVSLMRLYRPFLLLGALLTVLAAALALQWGPWAGRTLDVMLKDGRRLVQYTPFEAGQFKEVGGGRSVFYTAEMDPHERQLTTIFGRFEGDDGPYSIIVANQGRQQVQTDTGEREVVLFGGARYRGVPGQADFDVVRFDELKMHIALPEFIYVSGKRALIPTSTLLASDDLNDIAELQWRLSAPLSVMVLTLLAVPLSHIEPRQGRYAKLVFGIVVYLMYSNLLGLGRSWITEGIVPASLGIWWVHALVLCVGGYLFAKRQGWLRWG